LSAFGTRGAEEEEGEEEEITALETRDETLASEVEEAAVRQAPRRKARMRNGVTRRMDLAIKVPLRPEKASICI
jgi:hypothetical protein